MMHALNLLPDKNWNLHNVVVRTQMKRGKKNKQPDHTKRRKKDREKMTTSKENATDTMHGYDIAFPRDSR